MSKLPGVLEFFSELEGLGHIDRRLTLSSARPWQLNLWSNYSLDGYSHLCQSFYMLIFENRNTFFVLLSRSSTSTPNYAHTKYSKIHCYLWGAKIPKYTKNQCDFTFGKRFFCNSFQWKRVHFTKLETIKKLPCWLLSPLGLIYYQLIIV